MPPPQIFKTTYQDATGKIQSDMYFLDRKFTIMLDGIKFTSDMLDDFAHLDEATPTVRKVDLPKRFTVCEQGFLTNYIMKFGMPLPVINKNTNETITTLLEIFINLNNNPAQQSVVLSLKIPNITQRFEGKSGLFEIALKEIQEKMPQNYHLKCCFGCAFSDYTVYGQGFWGTMLCYEGVREKYSQVKDKDEFMDMMDEYNDIVAETHLCPDFQVRKKGTGYRG